MIVALGSAETELSPTSISQDTISEGLPFLGVTVMSGQSSHGAVLSNNVLTELGRHQTFSNTSMYTAEGVKDIRDASFNLFFSNSSRIHQV